MVRRAAVLTLMLLASSSLSASASEETTAGTPLTAAVARAAKDAPPQLASWAVLDAPKRPGALTTLYATYGVVQALDIVSTRKALATGAGEQNPLMGNGHIGRMIAVKAATGASTIYFAERLWKKNKVGAIVMMAGLNGVSAVIAARNQYNARR